MIRPRPAGRRPRRGETLVATAIIGLLFGLLLMGVQAARQSSRRLQCASNLRQLGQALAAYATAFGSFPYGNSSAASIPLALSLAVADGRIRAGQRLLCTAAGAGLVEAGALIRWPKS